MHQTKGVDLSEHNGNVDFAALRAAGVEFVLLRLGYGSDYAHQDDARFTENWEKAEAAGLPWGAYLYSYATNTNMAQSEADHALRLLQGKTPLYGVWYDVEDPQISSADVVSTSRTFCSALEEAGYYTGIYASLSWLNGKLNSTRLDKYDKWVAQWNHDCTYTKPYGIWQYTDRLAIGGKLFDGNWAYKDYPRLVQAKEEKEEPALTEAQVQALVQREIQAYFTALAKLPASPGWGEEALAWAREQGLLQGDPDGSLRPRCFATREEIAKMFANMHKKQL